MCIGNNYLGGTELRAKDIEAVPFLTQAIKRRGLIEQMLDDIMWLGVGVF